MGLTIRVPRETVLVYSVIAPLALFCRVLPVNRLPTLGLIWFLHMLLPPTISYVKKQSTCRNNYYYNVIDGQLFLPVFSSASLQSPSLPV